MLVRDKDGVEYDIPESLKDEFDRFKEQQHVPSCEAWQGTDFSRYRK